MISFKTLTPKLGFLTAKVTLSLPICYLFRADGVFILKQFCFLTVRMRHGIGDFYDPMN